MPRDIKKLCHCAILLHFILICCTNATNATTKGELNQLPQSNTPYTAFSTSNAGRENVTTKSPQILSNQATKSVIKTSEKYSLIGSTTLSTGMSDLKLTSTPFALSSAAVTAKVSAASEAPSTTIVAAPSTTVSAVEYSSTASQKVTTDRRSGYHQGRLSRLDERLEALDCDIPLLPTESRLWRGNETHELSLPIMIPEECSNTLIGPGSPEDDCLPVVLSWEGSADIQSGDILIVRINDTQLTNTSFRSKPAVTQKPANQLNVKNLAERLQHPSPQPSVYQVTRQGHEHCDVTEGVMLDITPLTDSGGVKLVTLYDKDLTEGVNLLIVVAENWGSQCVRLKVTVKSDNCGDTQDCSSKGVCYTNISMEGYECQCCPGFVGPHCEEQDACFPSPCTNNGICVDISQGHEGATYQCLCPYGYTGKNCQDEVDPCSSSPCQNGGQCTAANVSHFRCECIDGFTGELCDVALVAASAGRRGNGACGGSPAPCVHGICVDESRNGGSNGYRCFCRPGFAGTRCEYEYNECESVPCSNGGTCTDHVGGYSCTCGRGYTGNTCNVKVDLCSPNPCLPHRYCIDRGNSYSCECPRGYEGTDCILPVKEACSNSPCFNGGTCWSGFNSFYCACRAGYTGKYCEDNFIVEQVIAEPEVESEREETIGAREVHLTPSIYHDRLHNVYIAAGTLGTAIVIVAVVVMACHCRVNKTYAKWLSRLSRLSRLSLRPRRKSRGPTATDSTLPHHWLADKRAHRAACPTPTPPPPPPLRHPHHPHHPTLDTHDMYSYYTLDFSDRQNEPLIQ